MRLFVAIDIPEDIRHGLDTEFNKLKQCVNENGIKGIKWVSPHLWHITLKFIGEVNEDALLPLKNAIEEAIKGVRHFDLTIKGIGCFPNYRNPKVIWFGVKEAPEAKGCLETIHRGLEMNLSGLGIGVENRRFHSHLTVGRIKKCPSPSSGVKRLIKCISTNAIADIDDNNGKGGPKPLGFTVNKIILYKSVLTPRGPIYTALRTISFPK